MTISRIHLGSMVRGNSHLMTSFQQRRAPAFREIRPFLAAANTEQLNLVREYSLAFADRIDMAADKTLREIMGEMKAKVPGLETLGQLADAVESGSSGFREIGQNPAYQGFLWAIRCAPKTDCHVHISNNLHESDIADIMIKNQGLIDKMLDGIGINIRAKHEDKIREYVRSGNRRLLAELLRDCFENEDGYDPDFVVVSEDIIKGSVEAACETFFEDGVYKFDIRFNPFKKAIRDYGDSLTMEQWQEVVKGSIDALKAGIESAKRSSGYEDADIGMIFCFNRSKRYSVGGGYVPVEHMARLVFDWYKDDPMLRGVDVSGDEIEVKGRNLDPYVWNSLLRYVRENDRYTTVHLDFRFTRKIEGFKDGIDRAIRDGIGSPAFRDILNRALLAYLPFAEGFVNILCRGSERETGASGIGHGYILNPDYLITPLWDGADDLGGVTDVDKAVICSLPDGSSILDRIELMRRTVIDNGIIVEHNPPAMFRDHKDMPTYSHSMANNMIGQGFDLRIGTDAGVFSFNRPRTLSEAIAHVLISAPKGSPLTVGAALRASGVSI